MKLEIPMILHSTMINAVCLLHLLRFHFVVAFRSTR
ncbi:unnamed protein product, partial [Amoebophrya sp. A120]|eukprot:GSA120T00003135001.1